MTEPKSEDRMAQPYMGMRTRIPMQELGVVIPQYIGEVFAFLGKQGVAPVHAPFVRYHVINMPEMLDIEVGIPVASPLPDEDRIHGGVLPAGRYASLVYTGIENGIQANAALMEWGARHGLVWDSRETKDGEAFGSRFESFLTDPEKQPDQGKWETEVAIRLAESQEK
ncbi:GyrI-like domain-containing protein [Ktedonobacter sp. SOSP1-52]|uniref:GyrI-like domain-containing protein n=1 Tax=Ktedonobacter sp. SOSP1-52 TaxID=2778366 RepID=UPI00210396FC|nr:GyrI-like domain-containing protein [Ktedonobacter sp. SOSP1-52]